MIGLTNNDWFKNVQTFKNEKKCSKMVGLKFKKMFKNDWFKNMIGLKMFKIAYFGLKFREILQRRGFAPAPLAVNVAIQCEIVLLKSLIMLKP